MRKIIIYSTQSIIIKTCASVSEVMFIKHTMYIYLLYTQCAHTFYKRNKNMLFTSDSYVEPEIALSISMSQYPVG